MMFNLQTPITMKLLLLVFPLIWFEVTFGVRSEPDVIRVEEGSDVILPCSPSSKESIEFKLFVWKKDDQKEVFIYDSGIHTNNGRPGQDEQFKGRVSHFPDELKSGNASIIIRNTTVGDSGDYTCDFPQLQPRQIFHIKLVVEPNVIRVEEGSDVILPCSLSSKEDIEFKLFVWKKDDQKEVFIYDAGLHTNSHRIGQDEQFKGRVSHFEDELKSGNASITIRNTKVADSGVYTCEFPQLQTRQIFHIKLVVEPDVIKVEEGSDAVLPCSLNSKENIVSKRFDWKKDDQKKVFFYDSGIHTNIGHTGQDEQFKGRVSHFDDGLKSGNASIIIRNTTVTDSGVYTCEFPQLQPRQIFHIKLLVGDLKDRTAENIPGTVPEPSVTSLNQTADWSLLQCKVRGAFPNPILHWQDSDGSILPAEEPKVTERGDVILQINVNKTDNYRCVATQEEIRHQIYAETHVFISEFPTGLFVGSVLGTVVVVVVLVIIVLAVLVNKSYITLNSKKDRRAAGPHNQHENVKLETAGC